MGDLRMDEGRLTKKVMNSRMSGNRVRGRPQYRWKDGVKKALNDRGVTVEEARVIARERNEWRAIVNTWTDVTDAGFSRPIPQVKHLQYRSGQLTAPMMKKG